MNKKSKRKIVAGSVIALGLVFVSSGAVANADTKNLEDIKNSNWETRHENFMTNRLSQAVSDGKLTQAQADLIITKKAEIKANHAELQNKTREERRQLIKEQHDALLKWAEENNIPSEFIMPFGKKMKGRVH